VVILGPAVLSLLRQLMPALQKWGQSPVRRGKSCYQSLI